MTLDQWFQAGLNAISLLGLFAVIIQLRDANRQKKLESQIRLYDINRELIGMGFSKPELFKILKDEEGVEPTIERRYLQLWMNQLCLVNSFAQSGTFTPEDQESFETDLRDMVTMKNMRRHWKEYEKYYPASFRRYVNHLLHDAGYKGIKKKSRRVTS